MQAHPVRAYAMGGRQVRTQPIYGNAFDHYRRRVRVPRGAAHHEHVPPDRRDRRQHRRGHRRDQGGLRPRLGGNYTFRPKGGKAERVRGRDIKERNPYEQEHIDMIESIRSGQPLNELQDRRREHLDGHHGADVGLHRQGRHLGSGAQLEARPDAQGPQARQVDVEMPTPPVAVPGETPAGLTALPSLAPTATPMNRPPGARAAVASGAGRAWRRFASRSRHSLPWEFELMVEPDFLLLAPLCSDLSPRCWTALRSPPG